MPSRPIHTAIYQYTTPPSPLNAKPLRFVHIQLRFNTFAYKIPFICFLSHSRFRCRLNRSTSTIRFNKIMHPENKTRTLSALCYSHILECAFPVPYRTGIWRLHERRRIVMQQQQQQEQPKTTCIYLVYIWKFFQYPPKLRRRQFCEKHL